MSTTSTNHLPDSNTTKQAWTIRREEASKHGVNLNFISWKSCVRKARTGQGKIVDIAGYALGTQSSKLTRYAYSNDFALVFKAVEVAEATGVPLAKVNAWAWDMKKAGRVSMTKVLRWKSLIGGNGDSKGVAATIGEYAYSVNMELRPYDQSSDEIEINGYFKAA